MTAEFIRTEPVTASDGAAYCPIERRRRGPAAIAVSMTVLLLGAGFLTFSIMSTPAPVARKAAPASPQRVVISVTAPETDAAAEKPAVTVEEALAESRAARAGSLRPDETVDTTLAPRIKPEPAPSADDETAPEIIPLSDEAFMPRIKPVFEAGLTPAPIVASRPTQLGGVMLASAEDAPPPVFFEGDVRRREVAHRPAALAFAQDIDRQYSEMRIRITKGETFVDALKRAGVNASDRNDAAYAFGKQYNLRKLLPGQEFVLTLGWPNQTLFQLASEDKEPDARLLGLEFRSDPENRIIMRRDKSGAFEAQKSSVALTAKMMSIAGRINGSLYMSAKAAGAPDTIIADLADAFSYDVDFQREIFGGDEFEAIFEERYDDQGKMVSAGDILYARLKWRGRSKEKGYYRFEVDGLDDFYDATGRSAKRLLMKTPIDGARLSSGFGTRKHPILGYARAHKGVDFAAPRGTPIKAAGDGVIERASRYGSFGNYIRIRHANGYETAYAHLNGYARGIRAGKRVRQGDIIGYVGTTGRSTGPHLHYEVHLNGQAINPQRLKIKTTGKQLTGADLDRFKAQRDMIDAMRALPETGPALLATDSSAGKNAL